MYVKVFTTVQLFPLPREPPACEEIPHFRKSVTYPTIFVMEENLKIILNFFKRISPPESESDTEDGDAQLIQPHSQDQDQPESRAFNDVNVINGNASNFTDIPSNRRNITGEMSDLRINEVNIGVDEVDGESTESTTTFIGTILRHDENGIDAFVRCYGLDTVVNIFNSITSYPPENMMTLLHSFQQDQKITSIKTHKSILKIEISKLQDQIHLREKDHKEHLLRIMLLSPHDDQMPVQKRRLSNYLTVSQLTYVVLEMEGHSDIIEELDIFKDIEEKSKEKTEDFMDYCNKRLKEMTWSYIEKLLMNVKPIRSECRICSMLPIEFAIVDCGHYRLCEECINTILKECEPKCPFCRTTITEIKKIYE